MLPEKKPTATSDTGRAIVLDLPNIGEFAAWICLAPIITRGEIGHAAIGPGNGSGHGAARRVLRRQQGNDLPLIGLRSSLKLRSSRQGRSLPQL
jgi:hypothetical protein